jgi:ATP-dependent protease ClpP protease subunit
MISPLASVDSTAKIGKNVTIQPFAYIEGDVEIGDDCVIMSMTPVNNISMTSVISQLLYLNAKDIKKPIHLYISSPGGSVFTFISLDTAAEFP